MIQEGVGVMEGKPARRASGISPRARASLIGFAAAWLKSTLFL
jgi:hypothetical protein